MEIFKALIEPPGCLLVLAIFVALWLANRTWSGRKP